MCWTSWSKVIGVLSRFFALASGTGPPAVAGAVSSTVMEFAVAPAVVLKVTMTPPLVVRSVGFRWMCAAVGGAVSPVARSEYVRVLPTIWTWALPVAVELTLWLIWGSFAWL